MNPQGIDLKVKQLYTFDEGDCGRFTELLRYRLIEICLILLYSFCMK